MSGLEAELKPAVGSSILHFSAEKANSVSGPDIATRRCVAGCEDGLVESSSAIARLGDAERESLAAYAARASWPAGFVVYQRSAAADGVFVVSRGRIVLRSRVRAGRGFVPWIASPGETFGSEGLSHSARYATDARADEESETLFLSSARFRAFVREQPQHSLTLINQLMAERAMLLDKLRELTTLSVEQRLIATLVRMASNNTFTRDDGHIVLCTSRYRLLCELVGATRESVSLVLGRLTGEGVIEREGTTLIVSPTLLADRLDTGVLDAELAFMPVSDGQEQALH
jgi:CRP-like cAMP-binding protein